MPDAFWVYMYKVHRCPQSGSHDWTRCPYAHTGERARRRDPRRFSYLAEACPAFRESQLQQQLAQTGAAPTCIHGGLRCRYAHGVFELWLHPARFRTVLCEAGAACPRRVCFFAHSTAELRGEHDPVPLAGMPPPPPHVPRVRPSSPLSFPRQVDLAMLAMPGKVRLMYRGAAATSASSSSSSPATTTVAVATAAPVPALPLASPDDEDPAGKNHSRRGSEDGSVAGDYPHFDLIRDMVNW